MQNMLNKSPKAIIATPKDVHELFDFEKICFEHAVDQFPKRNLLHLIKSPTSRTLIVRDEKGKIYATVTGLLRHFKIPSGRVYKIGVLPTIKRQGIGSFLLQTIEKWFKEKGMKKACAEVRKSNWPSRKMFEKQGYKKTSEIIWYYANGEDAAKYWKHL